MTVPLLSLLTVRYYVTFGLMHKPSICRLSVQGLSDVYDVAPYAATWTFRQYFAPSNSLWTQTVCIKFFGKNSKGFSGTLQAKYKRIGNNMKGAAGINQTALGKQTKNTFCGTAVAVPLPKFCEKLLPDTKFHWKGQSAVEVAKELLMPYAILNFRGSIMGSF